MEPFDSFATAVEILRLGFPDVPRSAATRGTSPSNARVLEMGVDEARRVVEALAALVHLLLIENYHGRELDRLQTLALDAARRREDFEE